MNYFTDITRTADGQYLVRRMSRLGKFEHVDDRYITTDMTFVPKKRQRTKWAVSAAAAIVKSKADWEADKLLARMVNESILAAMRKLYPHSEAVHEGSLAAALGAQVECHSEHLDKLVEEMRGKHHCVDCGAPATHERPYRDVCPTDRGEEVREGYEWVCDDCDPIQEKPYAKES